MNSGRDAIPSPLQPEGQALYGLLRQLDESQWWSAQQLLDGQLQQLERLISHATRHSPFYREHLKGVDLAGLSLDTLREIPLLTRALLQEHNKEVDCAVLPEGHGVIKESTTSGSTGFPVKIRSTALASTVWHGINMRENLWQRREFDKVSASIRWHGEAVGLPPDGVEFEDWGLPVNLFYQTGRGYFLNSSTDISLQIAWLKKIQPSYLMIYPSNLRALLARLRRDNTTLQGLLQVRTIGESINAELRSEVAEQFRCSLVDLYSSEELGYMAIQCPVQNHYHVQSESVLLEVLREDGSPCDLHEPGKIVVTSLRNYATPLIRYEIGDYGELGGPCSCGRGLPVLKRVHGRVRNMLLHPDGSMHWPGFGYRKFLHIAPLKQFQLVQHDVNQLEFKVVVDRKLSSEQEEGIREILRENLGHPFAVNISYHQALARSASGKFEDFVSMLSNKEA